MRSYQRRHPRLQQHQETAKQLEGFSSWCACHEVIPTAFDTSTLCKGALSESGNVGIPVELQAFEV